MTESSLYQILQWVKRNGDADTLARLRLKLLPETVREGIIFDRVTPDTDCSEQYLASMRRNIREMLGKDAPP